MSSRAIERAAQLLAAKLQQSIPAAIRSGENPDGTPFAPYTQSSRMRGRRDPVKLMDTGIMLASLSVVPLSTSVHVSMDSPSGWHHGGTSRMAARRVMPDGPNDGVLDMVAESIDEAVLELGFDDIDKVFGEFK